MLLNETLSVNSRSKSKMHKINSQKLRLLSSAIVKAIIMQNVSPKRLIH